MWPAPQKAPSPFRCAASPTLVPAKARIAHPVTIRHSPQRPTAKKPSACGAPIPHYPNPSSHHFVVLPPSARRIASGYERRTLAHRPPPHLTVREMEVVVLLCSAECLLEKEMPDRLGMSLSTFKTHKEHVFAKCHVNSRLQLMHKAVHWRWVVCACGAQGVQAAALPIPLPMDGPPTGYHGTHVGSTRAGTPSCP